MRCVFPCLFICYLVNIILLFEYAHIEETQINLPRFHKSPKTLTYTIFIYLYSYFSLIQILGSTADPEAITWEEFRDNFRQCHIPAGLMIVKKEEFSNQGPMSASEYRDRFLQLSRYAPEEVNTDAKRQYHFLRGLVDPCTIS
jgi:hypothetical protein